MTRAYRLVGKIKNNRLWTSILDVFPEVKSQHDAAIALGMQESVLGWYLNMRHWPGCRHISDPKKRKCACVDGWSRTAWRIAKALHDDPNYLFAPELYGRTPRMLDVEIDRPMLESAGILALPPATPEDTLVAKEKGLAIEAALDSLEHSQQAEVIRHRFGLDTGEELRVEDVGEKLGLTPERIRQIEARALRRLRDPRRSAPLRRHIYGDDEC